MNEGPEAEVPGDAPTDAPNSTPGDERPVHVRRAPMALLTWAFMLLVLLIVVVLIVLKITQGSTTVTPPPVALAPVGAVQATTSVPLATFDAVGAPSSSAPGATVLSGQPALVADGKAEVVYVGAEFCPYCAAERWVLVVALGRFGTFTRLGATSSSGDEVFPATATFSFAGSSYKSRYVTLSAVEEYGSTPSKTAPAGFPRLRFPTAQQQSLMRRYDTSAYTSQSGALPFVDVGNRLLMVGAAVGFSPGTLANSSMNQIASALDQPNNAAAQAILGQANELERGDLCVDGRQPRIGMPVTRRTGRGAEARDFLTGVFRPACRLPPADSAGAALEELLALGFVEAPPDPVRLTDPDGVLEAIAANHAGGADLLGPHLAIRLLFFSLSMGRREEDRGLRPLAGCPGLPSFPHCSS